MTVCRVFLPIIYMYIYIYIYKQCLQIIILPKIINGYDRKHVLSEFRAPTQLTRPRYKVNSKKAS